MNKILRIVTPLSGALFLLLLGLSVRTMANNSLFHNDSGEQVEKSNHYAFFLPTSDFSFFKNIRSGAIEAAGQMDCAITFYYINSNTLSLSMAPYTGVDGVAVYLYKEDPAIMKSLLAIADANIPIVQIENDVLNSPQSFFIGTNSFDSGKAIGRLIMRIKKTRLDVAIVYSEKNPGLMSDRALLEMGIHETVEYRNLILTARDTSLNPLDVEKITYELTQQNPPVDLIILTDPNDTLVTVQAIIDMNLVGIVQIIGFGDNQEIKNYIKKGIILGSIVRHPFEIGQNAVLALNEINTSGYTSAFVDTGISVITDDSDNLLPQGNMK